MQNKKMLIIIGVCVVLVAGGILFFTLGGGISSVEDITHDPRRPQAVQLGGTYVFYNDVEFVREDFTVWRIIGQTHGGYLAILFEPGVRGIAQNSQRIVLVSECLTRYEDFFAIPAEWNRFFLAAVDDNGWLYVLGAVMTGAQFESFHLYIYNAVGEQVEAINWLDLPGILSGVFSHNTAIGAYVSDGSLVYITSSESTGKSGFAFFSKEGEVLFSYESGQFEDEEFRDGTVGSGYFYGLFRHNYILDRNMEITRRENRGYTVRKMEIPTGRVVWENHWYDETGNIDNIMVCGYRGFLYLYKPTRLFVYDKNGGQLHLLRDLTVSGFRKRQIAAMMQVSAMSVLGDGRLHIAFSYYDGGRLDTARSFVGFTEFVFTPFTDDAAIVRMEEIAAQFADIPVIRFLEIGGDTTTRGVPDELLLFAEERGAIADISFFTTWPTENTFIEYAEGLITAVFAGTADWDIITLPMTGIISTDFALCAFVERGMVLDLLPFAEDFLGDNERYYTHLFEALLRDGGLYFLPGGVSVPVVLVPDDHPELEYLKARSESWTWAEFLQIVRRLETETGEPQISSNNAFNVRTLPHFVPNPISNVPQFFLFDEGLLSAMGRGERLEEFSEVLGLFAALADSAYNEGEDEGVFTFVSIRAMRVRDGEILNTRKILPIPTMDGEYIFYAYGSNHAVLTAGESPELAAEFLLHNMEVSLTRPFFGYGRRISSLIRPCEADITRFMTMENFARYETALYRANTFLRLPSSVQHAIHDAVLQYVHGALSRNAAVQRVADIMWIFGNE